jgi:DNA-binding beta-propeller fold protein YncE
MNEHHHRTVRAALLGIAISLGMLASCASPETQPPAAEGTQAPAAAGTQAPAAAGTQASGVPVYRFDPDWPKPLPNKWKLGGVTGLAVDRDDNVWVLNRPNDLRDLELHAELDPPTADCCVRPPSMIHIDKNGDVIGSFDAPQGHGLDVDSEGFVYIGQNTVRKYDPQTGQVVGEVPRAPETQGGGGGTLAQPALPRVPGRGGNGPVGTFPQPAGRGRGNADPAAQAAAAAAQALRTADFRAKYPPTTPMIVGGVEEIRLDEPAGEIYVADSYLGGRVMVFDLKSFAFKRGWGAYGRPLSEISTDDADRAYTPGGAMPKEFRGHLTLNFSNDGLVYAADRNANRIHVTTKDGKFLKEFVLAPQTGEGGSTGGVAFSPGPEQRLLFISDLTNNHIWFLDREDGTVLGQMGSMGENGGQWFGLHMIALDSQGNIYTGEVFNGERVQRFVPERLP